MTTVRSRVHERFSSTYACAELAQTMPMTTARHKNPCGLFSKSRNKINDHFVSTRRSRKRTSNLPRLCARQQARHATTRRIATHPREGRAALRTFVNETTRTAADRERQLMTTRFAPMPRSRHAIRHSTPCGAMRRFPDRAWASKCASSCRNVCSISAAPCSYKRGFNEMSFRRQSARPAQVFRRGFHSTRTWRAVLDRAVTTQQIARR